MRRAIGAWCRVHAAIQQLSDFKPCRFCMGAQVREKEDRFQQRSMDAFVRRGPRDAPADRPAPDADMEVLLRWRSDPGSAGTAKSCVVPMAGPAAGLPSLHSTEGAMQGVHLLQNMVLDAYACSCQRGRVASTLKAAQQHVLYGIRLLTFQATRHAQDIGAARAGPSGRVVARATTLAGAGGPGRGGQGE